MNIKDFEAVNYRRERVEQLNDLDKIAYKNFMDGLIYPSASVINEAFKIKDKLGHFPSIKEFQENSFCFSKEEPN